ncbi:hypothetical protein Tco_1105817 [Tanacetum coccineum]
MGDIPVQDRPERVSNLPNKPPLGEGEDVEEINNDETVNLVKSRELGKSHDTDEHRMESKAIMQESEPRKKIKKKEMIQISLDEEFAKSLYEEEQAQILIPQKAKQTDEREKVINWNDPDVLSSKKTGGSRKKTLARKRAGEKQSKEGAKRQKTEYEKEKEELKAYLDLKTLCIIKSSEQMEEDGYVIHQGPEGYDLMLWGDLKILFQPDEEDEVWRGGLLGIKSFYKFILLMDLVLLLKTEEYRLNITLSLSLITPFDNILDTPSPPSPQPPPQPPFMDEMNLMFDHLEYLLTSTIALPSPPHP